MERRASALAGGGRARTALRSFRRLRLVERAHGADAIAGHLGRVGHRIAVDDRVPLVEHRSESVEVELLDEGRIERQRERVLLPLVAHLDRAEEQPPRRRYALPLERSVRLLLQTGEAAAN